MIPSKNPQKFVKDYGHWWFLREFDYFPEPLEYYDKNLSVSALELIMDSKESYRWRLFDNEKDAKEASNKVRESLKLVPLYVGKNLETLWEASRKLYNK